MPKVVYTTAKGLVQQAGQGVQLDNLPYTNVSAQTAAFTIAQPGVYTVTAGAAVAVTMPTAASFPGGFFTVRNGDNFANFLTGSAEAATTKVFKAPVTGTVTAGAGQDQGSKLTLSAVTGGSATVYSDGKNYILLASSGSVTFSGA